MSATIIKKLETEVLPTAKTVAVQNLITTSTSSSDDKVSSERPTKNIKGETSSDLVETIHPFLGKKMISKEMELIIRLAKIAFINDNPSIRGSYCWKWLVRGEEIITLNLNLMSYGSFKKCLIAFGFKIQEHSKKDVIFVSNDKGARVKVVLGSHLECFDKDLLQYTPYGLSISKRECKSNSYSSAPFLDILENIRKGAFSFVTKPKEKCLNCGGYHGDKELSPEKQAKIIMSTVKLIRNGWVCEDDSVSFLEYYKKDEPLKPGELREKENCCGICHKDYKDGDLLFKSIKCAHLFHPKCISKWGSGGRSKFSCPACREEISIFPQKEEKEDEYEIVDSDDESDEEEEE